MSKPETDYSNTIIYKIVCKDTSVTDLYIGHTTNFVLRKNNHMYSSNCNDNGNNCKLYKVIRANGGWSNWEMMMLEFFKCNNCIEARQKEQEYYERLKPSLNSVPPFVIQPTPSIVKKEIYHGMYSCNRCGYSVKNVCDLKKHLKRKLLCKPTITDVDVAIQLAELCIKKDYKIFKCRYCDKSYNQQQCKSRHEKNCKNKICNHIQKAEPIYNTSNNIETKNIETKNNIIINVNKFGKETISHITDDPDFVKTMNALITMYVEVHAMRQLYVMLLLEPKNRNLILEKLNSRYIQTCDETGKIINKTKTECYNNIMLRLKDIFIKYLETNKSLSDLNFTKKTIVNTNIIKKRFDIDQECDHVEDYEPYKKNKYIKKNKADYAKYKEDYVKYKEEKTNYRQCNKAAHTEFVRELINGFIETISGSVT